MLYSSGDCPAPAVHVRIPAPDTKLRKLTNGPPENHQPQGRIQGLQGATIESHVEIDEIHRRFRAVAKARQEKQKIAVIRFSPSQKRTFESCRWDKAGRLKGFEDFKLEALALI